jgi:hypothetical protein
MYAVNNFDAPNAHFYYTSLFCDAQVEKVGNPGGKKSKLKEQSYENKSVMKLSQIHRSIELCLREITLCFEMNLQNLTFFLTVQFIFVF